MLQRTEPMPREEYLLQREVTKAPAPLGQPRPPQALPREGTLTHWSAQAGVGEEAESYREDGWGWGRGESRESGAGMGGMTMK